MLHSNGVRHKLQHKKTWRMRCSPARPWNPSTMWVELRLFSQLTHPQSQLDTSSVNAIWKTRRRGPMHASVPSLSMSEKHASRSQSLSFMAFSTHFVPLSITSLASKISLWKLTLATLKVCSTIPISTPAQQSTVGSSQFSPSTLPLYMYLGPCMVQMVSLDAVLSWAMIQSQRTTSMTGLTNCTDLSTLSIHLSTWHNVPPLHPCTALSLHLQLWGSITMKLNIPKFPDRLPRHRPIFNPHYLSLGLPPSNDPLNFPTPNRSVLCSSERSSSMAMVSYGGGKQMGITSWLPSPTPTWRSSMRPTTRSLTKDTLWRAPTSSNTFGGLICCPTSPGL